MAKVEKKRLLGEETLREFLREMLLIRRFEAVSYTHLTLPTKA